jgi:hypothetical protein
MQLSTIILSVLKNRRGKVHSTELLRLIVRYYNDYTSTLAPSAEEVFHAVDLLVEDSLIIKTNNGAWEEFQISNKGYARLRAWYAPKKLLSIMSNDLAKILSIVATILSILATYLSIKSRF